MDFATDSILESVRNFYDKAGSDFSRTRQKRYGDGKSTNWRVTDTYLQTLTAGQSVLDLGCGNGRLVSGLPEGVDYVGVDFSHTLLGEAQKLYPGNDFRFGNVVEPGHWDGLATYDAIFCVAVLHHIPQQAQQVYVLQEARKHLKKGGFLYLTVWNLWQEKFLKYHIDDHVEVPYNNKWRRFCVAFATQSLTSVVSQAGWDVHELFYSDRVGGKADILTGENLICVAR